MRPVNWLILLTVVLAGCIEPYEFVVKNNTPTLVVEGYISNVSFNETLTYPSDGRYFAVSLKYTSDVTNKKNEAISNAKVNLLSDAGDKWTYIESVSEPGNYILMDKDFKAVVGKSYKLQIALPNEEVYESDWQKMPQVAPQPMGNIGFEEVEKQVYAVKAGERVVQTIKGINVYVDLPKNDSESPLYYLWDFTPTWIYIAPLARSSESTYKCWATNENYLANYTLQLDNVGGYRKNLLFMETDENERIFENFSLLIRQFSMSENFYYFWEEMQKQAGSEGLFDNPPYNLQSNLKSINRDKKVSGYFSVVGEQARRWYFNKEDLSYYVHDNLKEECLKPYGPPARGEIDACRDCRGYGNGKAVPVKPVWWLNEQ